MPFCDGGGGGGPGGGGPFFPCPFDGGPLGVPVLGDFIGGRGGFGEFPPELKAVSLGLDFIFGGPTGGVVGVVGSADSFLAKSPFAR